MIPSHIDLNQRPYTVGFELELWLVMQAKIRKNLPTRWPMRVVKLFSTSSGSWLVGFPWFCKHIKQIIGEHIKTSFAAE